MSIFGRGTNEFRQRAKDIFKYILCTLAEFIRTPSENTH